MGIQRREQRVVRSRQSDVLFRCPNNEDGMEFLRLARKYLNKDSYTFKLRGRTPNPSLMLIDGMYSTSRFWSHVPLRYADNIGVYLIGKGRHGNVSVGLSMVRSNRKGGGL